MSSFDYTLSTLTKYRAGTEEDPFIPISESKKIIMKHVILSEIPVQRNRVQVTGFYEVPELPESGLGSTEFICDYTEGILTFSDANEGSTVDINYYGRGNHYVSSSRVWTKESNGNVTQTLQDIIGAGVGSWTFLGNYDNSVSYVPNNVVTFDGNSYICLVSTSGNVPTNTSFWSVFVQSGSQSILVGTSAPTNTNYFWIDTN